MPGLKRQDRAKLAAVLDKMPEEIAYLREGILAVAR